MGPKEVAEAHKGSDSLDVGQGFGSFDGLQFVFARLDSFWRKGKLKVGYFFVAEYTFLQINFQVVLLESLKYFFQGLEMSFMGVRVDKQIINVDNNILKVPEYSFHKSLK